MKTVLLSIFIFSSTIKAQDFVQLKIDSVLDVYNNKTQPGFSVGIVKDGKLIFSKGFGLSNLEYNIYNSDTSVHQVASITKQFVASCVWALIKQNKLSLDDDIRKYLPELPEYGHVIKIKHLLNHTSGLRNYHALMNLSGFDYDRDYYDNYTVLNIASKQKALNNIPGQKVIYGNTSYNLAAMIVERISETNLNEFAAEFIFKPLGMTSTFVCTENNSTVRNRAVGYVQNKNNTFSQYPKIQCSYGAGGINSTILDMAKWSLIFTNENHLYKELKEFLVYKDLLPTSTKSSYARGVIVDDYNGLETIHHSGFSLGSQSQTISIPKLSLSVIILANSNSIDPVALSYKIIDLFISETQDQEGTKPSFIYSNTTLQKYIGQYQEINSDMKMELIVENDTLKVKGSQSKKFISLVPFQINMFYRKNNETVTYEFPLERLNDYDMKIDHGGAPFYFKRVVFDKESQNHLNEFTGKFYSSELDVSYLLTIVNGKLMMSYKDHEPTILFSGQKDEFGNGNRVLYSFKRNNKQLITGFSIASEGTVKDIEFIKTN
jgi:CubicO group peptidase (beta-lactamase class C family)